ncbi:MAG: iron ABC transporter substrate-binding protein, partial [Mesorhizobium sp.]
MRWLKSVLALPASALFLVQAFAAEIETAKGPVTVGKTPQTLAVFDIAAVDTLNSLGVKIAGLPDRLYVPELAELKDGAETVGTIFEPDLEALSALA